VNINTNGVERSDSSALWSRSLASLLQLKRRGIMIKKICFILSIMLIVFLVYGEGLSEEAIDTKGAAKGEETGEGLSEIVIRGEAKDTVKVEKASYGIEIKLEDIVSPSIEKMEALMEGSLEILRQKDFEQFSRLSSDQVIRPDLPSIPEPPLVTFYPEPSRIPIKKWELVVADEKGNTIRSLEGKGGPPRSIKWDGRDERGRVIRVGALYSYNFVAVDENGRPHTTGGKPFQLLALKYDEKDSVNVEVGNRVLYTPERDKFSEDGKLIMEKVLDILRQYSRYPFRVEICSDEPDLSVWEKAKALLSDHISKNLILLPENLKITATRGYGRGSITSFIIQTR